MQPTDFAADAFTIPWGRIALVLVLTVLATLGAAWAARGGLGRGAARGGRLLNLVDTLSLGPQRTLYVVEAGNRLLLIGGTKDQLTSLGELEGHAPAPPAPAVLAPPAPTPMSLLSPAPEPAPAPRDSGRLEGRLEKLARLEQPATRSEAMFRPEPKPIRLVTPPTGALGPSPFDHLLETARVGGGDGRTQTTREGRRWERGA